MHQGNRFVTTRKIRLNHSIFRLTASSKDRILGHNTVHLTSELLDSFPIVFYQYYEDVGVQTTNAPFLSFMMESTSVAV